MKRRITDCNGNTLTLNSSSLLILLFTFLKTIMKYWRRNTAFFMPLRKMMIMKTFQLQDLPRLALADECAPLRVRYKTMTVWNMRLVYIYILYPLKTTSFVMVGSSFPKDNHSLSENTHTPIHTSMYTQELMANSSTWTKLSVYIYSMVIFPLNFLRYSLLAWSWRLIGFVWRVYCS